MAADVRPNPSAAPASDRLPRILLIAGVLYSLLLLLQVPGEVFFNGDGGMKFLLARQFLAGQWGADIRPPDDPFVQDLWQQGYGPLHEPFVYRIDGRYVQCFPVYFSLLTAPLYALLGFRGLYVVPLASLWVVWLRFWRLSRSFGIPGFETSLALAAMIFASPLTIYGAAYWEHTLAVALAFCGITELLTAIESEPSRWRLVAAGGLLGLAGWLRPENICFAAAWLTAWVVPCHRAGRLRSWAFAAVGVAGALAGFFALNQTIYDHPLGAHSFSVVRGVSFFEHLRRESLPLLLPQCAGLVLYMPQVLLIVPLGIWHWFREPAKRLERLGVPLLAVLLLLVSVPLIIDHIGGLQWGPRYLLSAVPLLGLIAALVLQEARQNHQRFVTWLFVLLTVLGTGVNSGLGFSYLSINYHERVLPVLHVVEEREEEFVVVNHQHVALELTSVWDRKRFLRAENADELLAVAAALHRHGVQRFLLLHEGNPPSPLSQQGGLAVETRLLGQYGRYRAYEAQITVQQSPRT